MRRRDPKMRDVDPRLPAQSTWTTVPLLVAGLVTILAMASSRAAREPQPSIARPSGPTRMTPRLFGGEQFATPDYEGAGTLSADGAELYFVIRSPVGYVSLICVSRQQGGRWGAPEVASFSGVHFDTDPALSPDGSHLFFASKRPRPQTGPETRTDLDLWVVTRTATGWTEPAWLGATVNSSRDDLHPSVDRSGTLYFASDRDGAFDLFHSSSRAGAFTPPQVIARVNSAGVDTHPAVAPDGQTLVFVSIGRPDEPLPPRTAYVRGDLYVSTRAGDGWSEGRRLPDGINTPAAEANPSFSGDGTRLLFTSERGFAMMPPETPRTYRLIAAGARGVHNGLGNLYEVTVNTLSEGR